MKESHFSKGSMNMRDILLCMLPIFVAVWCVSAEEAGVDSEGLDAAPEGSFTIVVIPDTHVGREDLDEKFDTSMRWIVDNLESQRIVFVSHVGDIVNRRPGYGDCENLEPWKLARKYLDRLHGRVPYGLAVGNHDMSGSNSLRFQEFFPASHFADFDWYGGYFPGDPDRPHASGNNANSYQLFSAEGYKFIFLHLECNAPDNVLEWANEVLEAHADRLALITTHMDLGPKERPRATVTEDGERRSASWHFVNAPKGRMNWTKNHGRRGNSPKDKWDKLYRHHPNLRIIFSGDQSRTETKHRTDIGDDGNTVHALMSDYRGVLRLYRFLPAEQQLQVITYDTANGELVTGTRLAPEVEDHQFTLPFKF